MLYRSDTSNLDLHQNLSIMSYQEFERSMNYNYNSSTGSDPSFIIAVFGSYLNFIIFLILVYLVLRALRSYRLANRVSGCNSLWLKGGTVTPWVLFEKIRSNIEAQNFQGVTFSKTKLSDKLVPSSSHEYLKVTYRKKSWYISAFPIANDGLISYWKVDEVNRFLTVIRAIPLFGPVVVDILSTPTLYTADVNNATDMMINNEIQAAIDELTRNIPEKREGSKDFKELLKAMTR